MTPDEQKGIRRAGKEDAVGDGVTPSPPPGAGIGPNKTAELLADFLETTGLIAADRIAEARVRAGSGSLAEALAQSGLAPSGGVARALAERHNLPFVDLNDVVVQKEATDSIPLHVLERAVALPYALDGNVLKIAIADPSDVHKVDEIRLATRATLELGVAASEDIELHLRKIARATEVWERAALVEDELEVEDATRTRTTSRPTTASPTHRSSASSTRSSSRRPRTAPPTSISTRRRTRS